jgi:hypothetical protein
VHQVFRPQTFNGIANHVQGRLKRFAISSDKSSNGTKAMTRFQIAIGGTPSADLVFTYLDETNSPMAVATPAKADGTTLSSFVSRAELGVPSQGTGSLSLLQDDIILSRNNVLYVIYTCTNPSGGGATSTSRRHSPGSNSSRRNI